jgi:hypothetical protein
VSQGGGAGGARRAWTSATEATLRSAGWTPTRCEHAKVQRWRAALEQPGGFVMSHAAARVLAEFGGLRAEARGPGIECARGSFDLNPLLAEGEEDRFAAFAAFVEGPMFPLGELDGGHAFLGIDTTGAVFLVEGWLARLGDDIYAALDATLEGRKSIVVAERGNWSSLPS